jgi:hypothetical protein
MKARQSYNPLLKSYPDSEKINAVSEGAEVVYVRLIAMSDDNGRYYGDAKMVMAKLLTQRMVDGAVDADEVEKRLADLERVGLIERYEVEGKQYLQMVNYFKRLRSDVDHDIRFPAQDGTTPARVRNDDGTTTGLQPNPTIPNQNQTQEDANASCSEPDKSAAERPVLVFPCVGNGPKTYPLNATKIGEYAEAYPGVDVRAECRKALQWLRDNTSKRKTHRGMPKFLNSWLERAQNRARPDGNRSAFGGKPPPRKFEPLKD